MDIPDINQLFLEALSQYGIITFVLPFLLIFSLVYLATISSKIFGDDQISRKIAGVFSFGFALVALGNIELVGWLVNLIPSITVWILGLFLLALVLALFNYQMPRWMGGLVGLITLVAFLVIAANAILNINPSSPLSGLAAVLLSAFTGQLLTVIIIFVILIIIVAWMTSTPRQQAQGGGGQQQQ